MNPLTITDDLDNLPILVGIDVGINNFAFCVYDKRKNLVCHWDLIEIQFTSKNPPGKEISLKVIKICHRIAQLALKEASGYMKSNYQVIVEWQTQRNGARFNTVYPIVKSIESVVNAYFLMLGNAKINSLLAASVKAKFKILSNTQGRQKKRMTVKMIQSLLEEKSLFASSDSLSIFEASEKKDDMADALLICLSTIQ